MYKFRKISLTALSFLFVLATTAVQGADDWFVKDQQPDNGNYIVIKGKVIDRENSDPLVFASITVSGTNIATVTNTDGNFTIKVPNNKKEASLKFAYIGYKNHEVPIKDLKTGGKNIIVMDMVSVKLTEISVFPNNPRLLIDKVLQNRKDNYPDEALIMTGFYRETIKKRWNYIGLSEAVVKVYKQPYNSYRSDLVQLYKGRKSTDVEKEDTLLFKLQGGPYSTLSLDIMKDPYLVLSDDVLPYYDYSYKNITRVDGRLSYVIDFKQKPHVNTPLFYGTLYIDVDKLAISSIIFNLNTEDKDEAGSMFIKKKPLGVRVYPTSANYLVSYIEKDGTWYFNYSRGEVSFKVNWKRKIFNTNYTTMVEMAITDWKKAEDRPFRASDRLKMNVIMNETVAGFSDKDFWGEYNTIDPEQSIESAIKKINRKLDRME